MSETKFVITCDYEWGEHGEDDDTAMPQDVFTVAQARKVATKHQREFPTHYTFRIWAFAERVERGTR